MLFLYSFLCREDSCIEMRNKTKKLTREGREESMFNFDFRIRFSECNKRRVLKESSIINLLQDTSTFHSEYSDVKIEDLLKKNLGWIILSWDIKIKELPKFNDVVTVETRCPKGKGLYVFRDFRIIRGDEVLVKAHSTWILLDLKRLVPTKIPNEMTKKYGIDEGLNEEWYNRKLKSLDDSKKVISFVVDENMIDSNNHMNNQKYIEKALKLIPSDLKVKRISVTYLKQSLLNDKMEIYLGRNKDGKYVIDFKDDKLSLHSTIYIEAEKIE